MNIFKYLVKFLVIIMVFVSSSSLKATEFELPTVTKAFDLFEAYPTRVSVGTKIAFKLKDTKMAPRVIEGGIQARIFALNDYDNLPVPYDFKDNCNIYISYVYQLQSEANRTNFVLRTVDEGWLYPTASQKSIKDGRYYVVFEKAGPSQKYFGIRSSDTTSYFEAGFILVVESNKAASLEKVINEFEKRKARLTEFRLDMDREIDKIPCYRYTRYADKTEYKQQGVESIALCESEQNIN